MVNFFREDFGIYGKMFSMPLPDVINLPISSFFRPANIVDSVELVSKQLNTRCIEKPTLSYMAEKFIHAQIPLSLLTEGDSFPLVRQALLEYGYKYQLEA